MLRWLSKKRISLDELSGMFVLAQQGQDESKDQLFAFLRSRMLSLARYRVLEGAEDIVHETLIVVHNRFSELDSIGGLLAFTNQLMRNKIGNVYQGRQRRKLIELDDAEEGYDLSDELQAVELERIVRESITRLGNTNPGCHAILTCLYQ